MPTGSLLSNLILLLFLLVPGYVALRGYLDSTVQLDTFTRIDKIFITIFFGAILLFLVLLANRIGLLVYIYNHVWVAYWKPVCVYSPIGFGVGDEISTDSLSNYSSLALLSVVIGESVMGYLAGYLVGTIFRVRSKAPQSSEKDLQQPWATAIRQSEPYDKLEIVTTTGDKIVGKLYRIGSPSEDGDVLLFGANKIVDENNKEPLGMSYHSFDDISQIQFPELEPESPSPEDNYILRAWIMVKNPIILYNKSIKIRDKIQEQPGKFRKSAKKKHTGFQKFVDEEIVGYFEEVREEFMIGYQMSKYDRRSVDVAISKASSLKKVMDEEKNSNSN